MARYATQDRFKISVSGHADFDATLWDTVSGQAVEREVPKVRAEAGGQKIPLPTRPEVGDLTITKLYDQDRDGALYRKIAGGALFAGTAVTVIELDQDGNLITGNQTTYNDCVVKSAQIDDGDANGQDPVKLTIVWSVGSVA